MSIRLLCAIAIAQSLGAQPELTAARNLARAVPGDLPTEVQYLVFIDDSNPMSDVVANAPKTQVHTPDPVFRVRFPHGSIMVDAGMDREDATAPPNTGKFFDDKYRQVIAALRETNLIVITHEHFDHVGTLVHSPFADELAPKTMLTREQVETLIHKPKQALTSMDSTKAHRYIVFDYDRVLPIAPGVVLIRAPGHTPGSQVVYVRLASGREIILSGDVAWNNAGILTETQKPESGTRTENTTQVAGELKWLHEAERAGVTVVVSHDGEQLTALGRKGILTQGLSGS